MNIIFLNVLLLNFLFLDLTSIQSPGAQRVKDKQRIPVIERFKGRSICGSTLTWCTPRMARGTMAWSSLPETSAAPSVKHCLKNILGK